MSISPIASNPMRASSYTFPVCLFSHAWKNRVAQPRSGRESRPASEKQQDDSGLSIVHHLWEATDEGSIAAPGESSILSRAHGRLDPPLLRLALMGPFLSPPPPARMKAEPLCFPACPPRNRPIPPADGQSRLFVSLPAGRQSGGRGMVVACGSSLAGRSVIPLDSGVHADLGGLDV